MKNRQALHEIIRASSLSIIFVELSFKPVYPTMAVKNFKFMENYNSWKIYLQIGILALVIFTHILPPPLLLHIAPANSPAGSIITSQATMTLNIRLLFYMICNFFKCDDSILL